LTLLVGQQEGHPACKKNGGWWTWALVSPDGVASRRMVSVSASVNLPLQYKVQKFSSGTSSPGWSRKKGRKTVVVVSNNHQQKWSQWVSFIGCSQFFEFPSVLWYCWLHNTNVIQPAINSVTYPQRFPTGQWWAQLTEKLASITDYPLTRKLVSLTLNC